jgi:hypothetical protein
MTTLLVEDPARTDDIDHLDFEPLTAVYSAPQACGSIGQHCLGFSAEIIFGDCCEPFVCDPNTQLCTYR